MTKDEFRRKKEWKQFSKQIREKQKVDPVTGSRLGNRANCHHMDPANYQLLDPERFLALNIQTHEVVEWLRRNKHGWQHAICELKFIMERMDNYL